MSHSLRSFKADIFQALAHPARVAIVEQLREGEISAGELTRRLGLDQGNGSQHLAILRAKNIVVSRRKGTQVLYSVSDKALIEVLDVLKRYFYAHLSDSQGALEELRKDAGGDEGS